MPEEPSDRGSATLLAGDEKWKGEGDGELGKLRAALEKDSRSRRAHEALIRGLLRRGRFADALHDAQAFATLDPDSAVARELLAYSAVVSGDLELAIASIEALAESDPRAPRVHSRAARAFEALGDQTRACAHWRSLADLLPGKEEPQYQAFRCRAKVLGEKNAVLEALDKLSAPGKLLQGLRDKLKAGELPSYEPSLSAPGEFEAKVQCAEGTSRCPLIAVVTPSGTVMSPLTPSDARAAKDSVAFSGLADGLFRVIVVGAPDDAKGTVEVRVQGQKRSFAFSGGGDHTVAAAQVKSPAISPMMMSRMGWW